MSGCVRCAWVFLFDLIDIYIFEGMHDDVAVFGFCLDLVLKLDLIGSVYNLLFWFLVVWHATRDESYQLRYNYEYEYK